jgi:hypothetical protein
MLPAAAPTAPAISGSGCIVAFMMLGMVMPKASATAIKSAAMRTGWAQPATVTASSVAEAAARSVRPIVSTRAGDTPWLPRRPSSSAPLITAAEHALKIRPYWSGRNPTTPMKNSEDPVT